jgi:hypothetical protein
MNERIDQLWGQALDAAVPETYSQLSHSQVLKVKQVFAQLIVRECANFIDSHEQVDKYGFALDIVYGADLMKHFGVEE